MEFDRSAETGPKATKLSATDLRHRIAHLEPWYHRIDLGNGVITPGDRSQDLVFALFRDCLPADLSGLTVLDLGANAAGLSIEFARRGADVVALEAVERSCEQADLVIRHLGLEDRITVQHADLYTLGTTSFKYDIVCYVGLSYHLRYPQLALDMLSRLCGSFLLASTQTQPGSELVTTNRAGTVPDRQLGNLHGWEPTETLFLSMMEHAGFQNARLVSTAPHPGESPGNVCGNRSYFWAEAAATPAPLPFVGDPAFTGKPENLFPPAVDFDLDPLLRLRTLESSLLNSRKRTDELSQAIEQRDARRAEIEASLAQSRRRVDELQQAVEQRDRRVTELGAAVQGRDKRVAELDAAIVQRDSRIRKLDAARVAKQQAGGVEGDRPKRTSRR